MCKNYFPAVSESMIPVVNDNQIAAVASLAHEIWNRHFVPIIGQAQVDYMLEKYQSGEAIRSQIDSGAAYFLSQKGGVYVGYLCLVPDEPPGKMMISKIYVLSEFRGNGIASGFFEFTKKQCAERSLSVIWLTVNKNNSQAVQWYEKRGFRIKDKVKKDIGNGFFMDDYIMECLV